MRQPQNTKKTWNLSPRPMCNAGDHATVLYASWSLRILDRCRLLQNNPLLAYGSQHTPFKNYSSMISHTSSPAPMPNSAMSASKDGYSFSTIPTVLSAIGVITFFRTIFPAKTSQSENEPGNSPLSRKQSLLASGVRTCSRER